MSILELSKTFDACLESILNDPQQKQEDVTNLDCQINKLKSLFLTIESEVKDIRMKASSSKELSLQESNRLLQRDIDIKKSTIEKYVTKLEEWEKELPVLKENSKKALAIRTDGNDFDSDAQMNVDEEEDEDQIEFEQV